jgi:hypothetical protein
LSETKDTTDVDLTIILIVRHPNETPQAVLDALAAEPGIEQTEVILVDGRPGADETVGSSALSVRTLLHPSKNMPRLKAIGVLAARGAALAFLEPKAVPVRGWLAAARATLARHPGAAFGGAVLFGGASAVDRAAYLFEYGAFPPEVLGRDGMQDLAGNNMVLPATALRRDCGDILDAEGLNKPFCQARLKSRGTAIVMVPQMQVRMETKYSLTALLASRWNYARCFGGTRAALADRGQRWKYRLGAPVVPALLLWRHLGRATRGEWPGLATLAVLSMLAVTWALGEAAGSWAGPGRCCNRLY